MWLTVVGCSCRTPAPPLRGRSGQDSSPPTSEWDLRRAKSESGQPIDEQPTGPIRSWNGKEAPAEHGLRHSDLGRTKRVHSAEKLGRPESKLVSESLRFLEEVRDGGAGSQPGEARAGGPFDSLKEPMVAE